MPVGSAQPLVSIVVPVYNGERYLADCLDSVLAQSYQRWELIVLDNASTDSSATIAAQYGARDSRVVVQRNGTTLSMLDNHNAALRLMSPQAKYCKPLMADDWLFPECVERMVQAAENEPAIGLVCALAFDGKKVLCDGWPYPARSVPGREVARAHLLTDGLYIFGSPTATLIRADLVRMKRAFYPVDNIAADYEACLDVLQRSNFAFVHQVLTFQRMHEESVTSATQRNEAGFVGRLLTLSRWGSVFLAPDEFRARLNVRLRSYYRMLASRALRGADAAFWKYHTEQLEKIGVRLSRRRLWAAMAREVLLSIFAPLDLAYRARERLRSRGN